MNAEVLKKPSTGRCRSCLAIGVCLLALAAVLGSALKPMLAEYFPVRFVRIQGAFKYLDKEDLERSLSPMLESGYLDLDFESARRAAELLPWIAGLQIQRIWPDTLVLRIEEHVPFARFGNGSLISAQGIVFSPAAIEQFSDLPLIDGPAVRATELLAAFREMRVEARASGLRLEKLRVGERGSWLLEMADGLRVELGRDAPGARFRRFIHTLALLGEQPVRSMVRVDLRYRNGYAVEWIPGTEPEWSSFVKRNDPRQSEAVQSI